jgi:hypothetical protein
MMIAPTLLVTPPATSAASVTSPATTGQTNVRRRLATVARRHAITGPMPDSRTRTSASGTVYRSNHGGPTAALVPVTASEISGKNVPQNTTKHRPTSTRLFSRKTASRENSESSRASDRRSSRRESTSATEPNSTAAMNTRNGLPSVEAPNAWIDSSTPERTRNVPSSDSTNVPAISDTFHTFSIPRFS